MHDLSFDLVTEAHPEIAQVLANGLTEHSLPTTGVRGFLPIAVVARDAGGALVGGISGTTNWNWLHLALFWIDEKLRHGGLGTELLRRIERAAADRGCTQAHLDTFSYQARPFYERHGYTLFATLEDYPPGQQRFFMRKRL